MNIENMNVDDLIDDINYRVDMWVQTNTRTIKPEEVGLDNRSAWELNVGDECIAVPTTKRGPLEYYGGFEYVESDCVRTVGDWTFYLAGDSRVDKILGKVPEEECEYED